MALDHYKYMKLALEAAKNAANELEVPVGALVVRNTDGEIIGRGANRTEQHFDPTAHAEIVAIREACAKKCNWRLDDCTLYVTLEPCPMCAAAICQARISTVVFGAPDSKQGGCGSALNIPGEKAMSCHPQVYGGIMEDECAAILTDFFKKRRNDDLK